MLMAGLLFWACVVLFGSRAMFAEGRGGLYSLLQPIKSRSPLSLMAAAVVCYAIAIAFCSAEIGAIQQRQGVIGVFFMASVIFGVLGSLVLSAYLFIDSD